MHGEDAGRGSAAKGRSPATAYINRIATAVPPHDVHSSFVRFASTLFSDERSRVLFGRMADKAQISHRFSVLAPSVEVGGASIDAGRFYLRGSFPTTADRMRLYEKHAPELAAQAVSGLDLGSTARRITHVIVTSCTGFSAPGIDLDLVERFGLDPSVERTMIGFMGCYAAINALKLARHIVRSAPEARVLVVNVELCTLHLQEAIAMDQMLSFLLFGDGCAAAVVSAEPTGLALDRLHAVVVPGTRELITWNIRDLGFEMFLSGRVPGAIDRGLKAAAGAILDGAAPGEIDLWAVHPGGRSVLDAVEHALELGPVALAASRDVLARFGNMSSATLMFVLQSIVARARPGMRGCAMSFGPGLTAETMLFHTA
ncbi:type III polyketide synthase [Sorangium sp. So ce295]|uniref:type III polyketide synthase n=1 Tax=Sorangium sp. So ce295 TaxID=3133295 RepID=UPI003F60C334